MSVDPRRARISRLLAVAVAIARPTEALGQEARAGLRATSGLSAEGIELALSRHLETDADEASWERLLAQEEGAPCCHVVLAANVCTAALRALAVGLVVAPRVLVRPSRRDPTLATLFARALPDLVTLTGTLVPRSGDVVHAYGHDETLAQIAETLPAGVALHAHGAGFGLAIVEEEDDLDAAARAIAEDVVPFDQAGCLSPRVVLVAGTKERAAHFGERLHAALSDLGQQVPRGRIDDATASAITMYRATVAALGVVFDGPHHTVGVRLEGSGVLLPPPARVVHVLAVSADDAARELGPLARFVTAIGGRGAALTRAVAERTPCARLSPLGAMQRPPLDGPVDRRVKGGPSPIETRRMALTSPLR